MTFKTRLKLKNASQTDGQIRLIQRWTGAGRNVTHIQVPNAEFEVEIVSLVCVKLYIRPWNMHDGCIFASRAYSHKSKFINYFIKCILKFVQIHVLAASMCSGTMHKCMEWKMSKHKKSAQLKQRGKSNYDVICDGNALQWWFMVRLNKTTWNIRKWHLFSQIPFLVVVVVVAVAIIVSSSLRVGCVCRKKQYKHVCRAHLAYEYICNIHGNVKRSFYEASVLQKCFASSVCTLHMMVLNDARANEVKRSEG